MSLPAVINVIIVIVIIVQYSIAGVVKARPPITTGCWGGCAGFCGCVSSGGSGSSCRSGSWGGMGGSGWDGCWGCWSKRVIWYLAEAVICRVARVTRSVSPFVRRAWIHTDRNTGKAGVHIWLIFREKQWGYKMIRKHLPVHQLV